MKTMVLGAIQDPNGWAQFEGGGVMRLDPDGFMKYDKSKSGARIYMAEPGYIWRSRDRI